MKKFLILLAAFAVLSACNSNQYNANSYIEVEKEPCFGFCPVYSFKVDGEGNATFHGERNVKKEGSWKRTMTQPEVNSLFKAFEKSNFWKFNDEYTGQVTDLPTIWVTFSHGGKTKTVKDYFDAPEELKQLEKLVEEIAETDEGWVKVE